MSSPTPEQVSIVPQTLNLLPTADRPSIQIAQAHGKPYPPQEQALGETPTILPDAPICAAFLFLFICAAAGHMTLFRLNLSRGKKFIISGMVFGRYKIEIPARSLAG